ncbi:helix-turn-helix transcriptional regulator [Nannocystis exedens]|uniref:helix-turn-helix transcriptional regulator n=1 Tax=Nannocystis exedens TaxID=54 RepID=UPI003B830400
MPVAALGAGAAGRPWGTVLGAETELATCLACSMRTVERWRSQGEGPPWVRKGRAVAYRTGDVLDWVRQETRGLAKQPAP